jgi:hypothetical protein
MGFISGSIAARKAKHAAQDAEDERKAAEAKVEALVKKRAPSINPYSNVTSLADMATDLSSMINNPFESLGVATQAAEMQAEEADIALANTLDTLVATGAGAGGATALANAALRSKRGVSASIEQQEANNEKLRAQGEQQMQQQKMAEQQRLQGVAISEGQREQAAEAQGRMYQFETDERRLNADLDRASAQERQHAQTAVDARTAQVQSIAGIGQSIGGVVSAFAGGVGEGLFKNSSDRRMKKNIKLIGKSKSGLNIYAFEYINKMFGKGVWQGVMSDEIPSNAVIKNFAGEFDGVDYSKIDVEFKQL